MLVDTRATSTILGLRDRALTKVFPELSAVKVTHSWHGMLAFSFDKLPHVGEVDGLHYAMGYWGNGFWENYTRTFPPNNYNVYGRLAGGAGPFSGTTLKLVTAGRGTTTQTTQLLGSFADPNPIGWENWHWVPMRDTNGNLTTITLGGVQTVRLTSGNNLNAHFLMLVPTVSGVKLSASLSGSSLSLQFPTVTGHNYTVLYNNTLVGGTWQPLSAAIPGDGTVKTVTDTVAGTRRFYRLQIQ